MLTDVEIRNAEPRPKAYKLTDGQSLYLLVKPNGSKLWRWRYWLRGKERTLAIGPYPEVRLKAAREARDAARQQVRQGIDPTKARNAALTGDTVEAIAREWMKRIGPSWTAGTLERTRRNLEKDVFPWIGARAMREIGPAELLPVLERVADRGALDMAHRTRQRLSQMWRWAIVTGRADRDPAGDLRGALRSAPRNPHAAILDERELGGLLRACWDYEGTYVVRMALRLSPYLFVRPTELRAARWSEFDLDASRWVIPAARMKRSRDHIVPLARQAGEILLELHEFSGHGELLFPGIRTAARPISENTLNAALRRLGYDKTQQTSHGWRAVASTLLHEQGWLPDAIERQLAHTEESKVKAAYNRSQHLETRTKMMQAWADYLDGLRGGADVVSIGRRRQS
jgi:integrase